MTITECDSIFILFSYTFLVMHVEYIQGVTFTLKLLFAYAT